MLTEQQIEELEKKIGYCFKEKSLLKQALTHSSFVNEQRINKLPDYERLEFLGDAVLEFVTSSFLFRTYPNMKEGDMTRKRASLVCGSALAYCAKDLELGRYIRLGKGEEAAGGRGKETITSDVMEAIIGAVYLDGGVDEASAYIKRFILSDLEDKQLFYDSKTLLQEYIQKNGDATLYYEVVDERGPDHEKEFVVEVRVNGEMMGRGAGRTKKAAEQRAAYEALLASKGKE